MTHSYTSNQILKYLYQDLPLADQIETDLKISTQPEWNKTYNILKGAITALPKVQFFPRGRVIRSILKYSARKEA